MTKATSIFDTLFLSLAEVHRSHRRGSATYALIKQIVRAEIEHVFRDSTKQPVAFGPFGDITIRYHSMGAVDSLNLFDLDELIIFAFYYANRGRYRKAVDIGANLGVHSIIMSRCGFDVTCYEPDPRHFSVLQQNLSQNDCNQVHAMLRAVSAEEGEVEFVRVLGNTTASHIAGAKANPYGDLERIRVATAAARIVIAGADIVKIDVEGHEKDILLATCTDDWRQMDALVEIENADNAASIFDHFSMLGVLMFAQKLNWREVMTVDDMPTSYREGSLFITCKEEMPW